MDYRNSTDFENGDNEDNEQERKILFQIKEIDNRIESVGGWGFLENFGKILKIRKLQFSKIYFIHFKLDLTEHVDWNSWGKNCV